MSPRAKRWGLVAAGAAIALAVTSFLIVRWLGPASPMTPAPSPSSAALSPTAARDLEANLSSGDSARIRKVLAVPTKEKLDPKLISGIASLGSITIREDTAVLLDDNSMRVYANVENGNIKTWTLLLTKQGASWLISSTLEGEQR